ncbi:MAG: FHA domain-containing protein [Sulfurimonas sp.]
MLDIEKKELLGRMVPKAALKAMTDRAKHTILKRVFDADIIPIFTYPFRIGREARIGYIDGEIVLQERHKLDGKEPNNDVYLLDNGEFLAISREHCSIVMQEDKYILQDRGSACGCMVNSTRIGGDDHPDEYSLKDGDIITLGFEESEYKFKFIVFDIQYQ